MNIVRGCGEIWNRLFDHRPFLNGELLYFQEEFEVKRSDREVTRLFEVLENVTEIRDSQLDKIKHLSETNLASFQKKVDVALINCSAILDVESKFDVDANLEVKREIRHSEWECSQTEMKDKYSKVDKTFDDREKELLEFYTDLEKKLHIDDPVSQSKESL